MTALTHEPIGTPRIRVAVQGQEVRVRANPDGLRSLSALPDRLLDEATGDGKDIYVTAGPQLADDLRFLSLARSGGSRLVRFNVIAAVISVCCVGAIDGMCIHPSEPRFKPSRDQVHD